MRKRDKIIETLFIRYPAFFKKHWFGFILAFSVFWLFCVFVVSGDFYKFMQYLGLFK